MRLKNPALIVLILAIIGFAYLFYSQSSTSAPREYENNQYGFTLTFPDSWGSYATESSSHELFHEVVRFSSEDNSRYLQVNIVSESQIANPAIIDYPQVALGNNEFYYFYAQGSGDFAGMPGSNSQEDHEIAAEIESIRNSFRLEN